MTFVALLTAIRRRWLVLVAGLAVGLAVAAAVTTFLPRTYAATASLYVSAVDDASAQNAYQGVLLSQQRVKSYTEILTSERVLRPVMDAAGIAGTTADFADHVAVTTDTDSTVMKVTVTEGSGTEAADLANAVASRFSQVVGQLERPTGAGQAPAVTVATVDAAVADPDPVSPRWPVNLVVGAVVGLLLGAAGAVISAATDRTLRRPAELAEVAGAPSLGSLPAVRGGFDPAAGGEHAEAVRRVRTNLAFADVDSPVRVITVTSPLEGEGRTSLVQALATAFAATSRVAVVEGDLRHPVLAERLGLHGPLGLTDVLRGHGPLGTALQRHGGVDVLVAGEVPTDPSGLLASRALGAVIDRLRETHDVVLVDAPPLGPVADAAVLAAGSDGAVLLCRAGRTPADAVGAAAEALRAVGARIVGTVLTSDGEVRAAAAPTVGGSGDGGSGAETTLVHRVDAERGSPALAGSRADLAAAPFDAWFTTGATGPARRGAHEAAPEIGGLRAQPGQ
ncbi:polysaccharide biosynthesis tyrosine autokinase [Actinomycetospora termitidis]|uniref:Polysaccharide biosynthesis tyrosine autokinase n=1 Tax=Actinomycetospora termitidis TaxID=3053470 RepID=A0ABT7MGS7_9PSEU|nr:polysaccharide biosynthesis tyrosine autokinase [Actinomycetospora sp. Odt1-22]MDL5159147.1 polysaccharide biosynthesis tyrosine autokinase [Actinomycetospora sp. Odt1-22]